MTSNPASKGPTFAIQNQHAPANEVAKIVELIEKALESKPRAFCIIGLLAEVLFIQNPAIDPEYLVTAVGQLSQFAAMLATTGPENADQPTATVQ